jgi:hypothetical protein
MTIYRTLKFTKIHVEYSFEKKLNQKRKYFSWRKRMSEKGRKLAQQQPARWLL